MEMRRKKVAVLALSTIILVGAGVHMADLEARGGSGGGGGHMGGGGGHMGG